MAESNSRGLRLQGFSTKNISSDLSAGVVKSIDSVSGGMANALLAGVSQAAHEQLLRTDFLSVIGEGNVFLVSEHGETTRQANEQAQQLILTQVQQPDERRV